MSLMSGVAGVCPRAVLALPPLPLSTDTYDSRPWIGSKKLEKDREWFKEFNNIQIRPQACQIRSEYPTERGVHYPPVVFRELTIWYFPGVLDKLPERLYRLRLFDVPAGVSIRKFPLGIRRVELRGVATQSNTSGKQDARRAMPVLEELPLELEMLSVSGFRITVPAFSKKLEHIRLLNCDAVWLPDIPKKTLTFISMNLPLEELPAGGQNLIEMVVSGSKVRRVAALPPNLRVLFLTKCRLQRIPILPHALLAVSFESTRIKVIENLPEGLLQANFADCPLYSCGMLPESLRSLGVKNTYITNFNGCPPGLRAMTLTVYRNTELQSLPSMLVRTEYNFGMLMYNDQRPIAQSERNSVHVFMKNLPRRAYLASQNPMNHTASLFLFVASKLEHSSKKRRIK